MTQVKPETGRVVNRGGRSPAGHRLRLVAGATLLLLAPQTRAEASPPSSDGVLLLPLRTTDELREQGNTFSALVSGELGKSPGLTVAGAPQPAAPTPNEQRELQTLNPATARLAAQAGKRFIIGGKLAGRGDLTVLQLYLQDTVRGSLIARESARVAGGLEGLRAAVPAVVAALTSHLHPPADTALSASAVVAENAGFLQYCYEEQLKTIPAFSGTVMLQFRVTSDNRLDEPRVDDEASQLKLDGLSRCIEGNGRLWRLPAKAVPGEIKTGVVEVPFTFAPTVTSAAAVSGSPEARLIAIGAAHETTLKTASSRTPAAIRFVNHTPGPVQIFWLDYKGKRRLYRTIPARLSHLIRTYVGHPWVVADASGRALEVFIPREASSVAVVESPLQAKAPSTEPTLKSIDSKAKASIRFVNRTTGTLQLYWLDYHGKRQLRDHVAPAQDRLLTTFATHPWVVTDAAGKALALYRPTDSGNWVAIIEPSSGH